VVPRSAECAACGAHAFRVVDVVNVRDVARLWVRDFVERGRNDADEDSVADEIQSILGAATIQFDRCSACGLEMSYPLCAWREGQYPSDQLYPVRWEFRQSLDDIGSSPRRVLELGCGSGAFLELARERGHEAIGMDFNAVAVGAALDKGLDVVHGGFDELRTHLDARAGGRRFDAVAMFQVIEHLEEPRALFDALEPFLEDEVRLFVSCPGTRRYTRLIRQIRVGSSDYWDFPPHHLLRWTEEALRASFGRLGWRPVRFLEEPLPTVGASAEIGCLRAAEGGYLDDPVRRRLAILWARFRLTTSRKFGAGTSMYFYAVRT
jgi:2-polyprenyl-3-methyl-5-hydroxy-6-metoxy-1,4-benzoquinol methylase